MSELSLLCFAIHRHRSETEVPNLCARARWGRFPSGFINPSAAVIVQMPKCSYSMFFKSLKAAGAGSCRSFLSCLRQADSRTSAQADIVLGYLPKGAAALARPADLSTIAKVEGIRFGLLKSFEDGQKVSDALISLSRRRRQLREGGRLWEGGDDEKGV